MKKIEKKSREWITVDMTDAARMTQSAAMETASMVLGIISLVGFIVVFASIPCGAMAVILGALSRGESWKMSKKAKAGVITGAIGMYLGLLLTVLVIFFRAKYPVLF